MTGLQARRCRFVPPLVSREATSSPAPGRACGPHVIALGEGARGSGDTAVRVSVRQGLHCEVAQTQLQPRIELGYCDITTSCSGLLAAWPAVAASRVSYLMPVMSQTRTTRSQSTRRRWRLSSEAALSCRRDDRAGEAARPRPAPTAPCTLAAPGWALSCEGDSSQPVVLLPELLVAVPVLRSPPQQLELLLGLATLPALEPTSLPPLDQHRRFAARGQ